MVNGKFCDAIENYEFETWIIHAHAPPNEEHISKKWRIEKKLNKLNVENPLRKHLEKLKEVYKVNHVIVEQKGGAYSLMFRPTTIELVIRKEDKDKFSDMEAFRKKINLVHLTDVLQESYPKIPEQWLKMMQINYKVLMCDWFL